MEAVQEESIDALSSLEERITRAVQVVTSLRYENDQLRADLRTAQEELESARAERDQAQSLSKNVQRDHSGLEQQVRRLSSELDELRGERKQVKSRIEKLLHQLDLLSAS